MKTKLRIGKVCIAYTDGYGCAQPVLRLAESLHSVKFNYDSSYINIYSESLVNILYKIKGRKILVALNNNQAHVSWLSFYEEEYDDFIEKIIEPIERRFKNG